MNISSLLLFAVLLTPRNAEASPASENGDDRKKRLTQGIQRPPYAFFRYGAWEYAGVPQEVQGEDWCTAANVGDQRCNPIFFLNEYYVCSPTGVEVKKTSSSETFCCPSIEMPETRITQISLTGGRFGFDFSAGFPSLICPTAAEPNPPSIRGEAGLQYCLSDDVYLEFPINLNQSPFDPNADFYRPVAPGTKCCQSTEAKWKIMMVFAGQPCPIEYSYTGDDDSNFGAFQHPIFGPFAPDGPPSGGPP